MDKKRVITLGIAGLSLILAASLTSTVAWYTGSSYLAITNINIELKDPKLQISINNTKFDTYVKSSDLNKVGMFTAVSSMFSNEWIRTKEETPIFKYGNTVGNGYLFNKASDFKNATEGYFSQTFYLKSDINAYVTFDKEQTNFLPDIEKNNDLLKNEGFMGTMANRYPNLHGQDLENKVLENLNSVVKSMRFSVLVLDDDPADLYDDYKYYIYDPNKTEETELGGILDTSDSGYYNTYNHKEVLYGEITGNKTNPLDCADNIVYDDPLPQSLNVYQRDEMTCFKANNAQGDQKFNHDESINNGLRIKKENSLSYSEVDKQLLIPISTSKNRRIVLSFYQEGWDLDNTNFIVYSHFLVNVSFMIAPVAPRD